MCICTADNQDYRVPSTRFVHTKHLESIVLARLIGSDSPSQPIESSRPEVCLLGPSSASCTGPSCVPTCQQSKSHLSGHFLSLHRSLSCHCLSLPFAFLSFACLTLFLTPFTCLMSIGAVVSRAMCRSRSSWVLCASAHSRPQARKVW